MFKRWWNGANGVGIAKSSKEPAPILEPRRSMNVSRSPMSSVSNNPYRYGQPGRNTIAGNRYESLPSLALPSMTETSMSPPNPYLAEPPKDYSSTRYMSESQDRKATLPPIASTFMATRSPYFANASSKATSAFDLSKTATGPDSPMDTAHDFFTTVDFGELPADVKKDFVRRISLEQQRPSIGPKGSILSPPNPYNQQNAGSACASTTSFGKTSSKDSSMSSLPEEDEVPVPRPASQKLYDTRPQSYSPALQCKAASFARQSDVAPKRLSFLSGWNSFSMARDTGSPRKLGTPTTPLDSGKILVESPQENEIHFQYPPTPLGSMKEEQDPIDAVTQSRHAQSNIAQNSTPSSKLAPPVPASHRRSKSSESTSSTESMSIPTPTHSSFLPNHEDVVNIVDRLSLPPPIKQMPEALKRISLNIGQGYARYQEAHEDQSHPPDLIAAKHDLTSISSLIQELQYPFDKPNQTRPPSPELQKRVKSSLYGAFEEADAEVDQETLQREKRMRDYERSIRVKCLHYLH
ncbi:hypothetical protein BZG36_00992 [Bifiguratus adelaidae]|uniref:Uncharacterized protein n=1 Tax=Bifiguratus adelaidae TaxID=1938954 RepID=A0A261Y6G1_9FUNG|nr:hypothetical protein BZG36_00992 [Bifiguratus adelaidae]